MNKFFLILFSALFFYSWVFAETFTPEYYLEGFAPLKDNEIDYYKFHNGFSITDKPKNCFENIKITTIKEIDYKNNTIKLQAKIGNIELDQPVIVSLEDFEKNNFKATFRKLLRSKSKETLSNADRTESAGLIPEIVIELPKIAQTKAIRKFMGNKAGRLSLDGNQKLTFSGSDTKRDEKGDENDRESNFDLEMKQDLNLRLRGTIGDKIHVNVNHHSSSDDDVLPTPTEININYEGYEDEVVKRIDAGNISLSLSGSKLFSYSVSSEGLFGIKTELEAGNLKISTILGKDEAKKSTQKYKGSTQADSVEIKSKDFVNRTHYYIDQPDIMFQLYGDEGLDGYENNAIVLAPDGSWTMTSEGSGRLPDPDYDFTLYVDDHYASTNGVTTIAGNEIGVPDVEYEFDILTEGTDYAVDYQTGLITLFDTVDKRYTIGITYTQVNGTVIGEDSSTPVQVKLIRKSNQEVTDTDYWNLQARNIYSLGMQNIKNDGFDLNIYSLNEDFTPNYNIPSGEMTFNKYLRLNTNPDEVINGDDKTIHLDSGFIVFPFLRPFESLGDSLIYTEEDVGYDEFENYISVKGKIGREQISLGQMNILPGSVAIIIGPNNDKLTENVDYIVDYDFGTITFLTARAKDSDVEIDISYQFRPLFSVESKTIMGLRADMKFNDNIKLGGTFIYQSEKVKEDRPKIGNENRSIILADIDGEVKYDIPFITSFIDFIPLIKTDEDSRVTLSGEVAMSLPRIYGNSDQKDIKEAYVDDMESIMDSYPLGVGRASWNPASRPAEFPNGNFVNFGKAKLNYYSAQDIYAREIYDPESLTEKEEKEKVSVLACKIKPQDLGMPGMEMKYWAGLMKYVGNNIDFSKKKYIEFLVKVDTLNFNQPLKPVVMHLNLGAINENFYTFTDVDGVGVLDFEDGKNGGYRDGLLDYSEDIGLDGIPNGEPGDDPNDDYDTNKITVNGEEEYPSINGTEDNDELDTEDLDDNGQLNMEDVYFEYTVTLDEEDEFFISQYKGWKLFRIPIHDSENYRIISNESNKVPNIKKICYARTWFEVEDSTRIKLVSLDLVGNKWEEGFIKDEDDNIIISEEETMKVGIIDNQKDMHYTPAPYTVIKKMGEETLEQSLTIDYSNIKKNHYGLVSQELFDPINMLGYDKIRFWVYTENAQNSASRNDPDSLIIRLGSDSTNYYEIRRPFYPQEYFSEMDRDSWEDIEIKFSDITYLKTLNDNEDVSYVKNENKYSKVGKPYLNNIKEISLGMKASQEFSGRLYFDDIRVADPYEEIGFASRASLNTIFADFSTLNIDLDWNTENFQSSATRRTSSSYFENTDFSIVNKYFLNKFFPAEWGLSLPLTLKRSQSLGIPRFKSNSDVLRDNLEPEDKKREKNKSLTYRADFSFSQNKTPQSKILEYLIKNTSINSSIEHKKSLSSTSADTTLSYMVKHTYKLTIPKENIGIRLLSNYSFYFFPNSFNNYLTYNEMIPNKWRWDTTLDSIPQWVVQSNTQKTRTFNTDSQVGYDIFSDISTSYKLTTRRDLMLEKYWKGYNIGEEKERTQVINFDYSPQYLDKIFSYSVDASANYSESHIQSGVEDSLYYKGNVTRNIGGDFTLKNQNMLRNFADWLDTKFTKKPAEEPEGSEEGSKEQPGEKKKEEEGKLPEEEEKLSKDVVPDFENLGEDEKARFEKELEDKEQEEGKDGKGFNNEMSDPKQKTVSMVKRSNIFASIVGYISRIENIKVNYDNTYKTTYDERGKRPEFLYQLGLPHILDEEGDDKEILSKTINDKYSTSFGFPVLNFLRTTFGYSKDIRTTYGDYSNIQITTTFPNVSLTLSELEKLIGIEKLLTSSRLSSSYVFSETVDGEIDFIDPDSEQKRMTMSPLISWNGNWKNNITSSISVNYSDTKNITHHNTYDITTQSTVQSLTGSLSWTFASAKGLKILFFKRTRLKNELTTDIGFNMEKSYSTRKGETEKNTEINKFNYSITPGASYKFNRNISAGLSSKYENNHDKKRGTKVRTFTLSIWIDILF
ncbi:MAG: hypothetical protein K8R49_05825 [Candidatus Cloacimonetes bacterium]|nr:hypothetical protein [Candidatus Cloacimonadota bacterium]